jgi:hypothetical protein
VLSYVLSVDINGQSFIALTHIKKIDSGEFLPETEVTSITLSLRSEVRQGKFNLQKCIEDLANLENTMNRTSQATFINRESEPYAPSPDSVVSVLGPPGFTAIPEADDTTARKISVIESSP